MYQIYLKNVAGYYYYPAIRRTLDEALILFFTYWKFVPQVMVTDSNDCIVLNSINGKLEGLGQKDIDLIEESYNNIDAFKIEYSDIEKLLVAYHEKKHEIEKTKTSKIASELRKLDANILALCAKHNINLSDFSYTRAEDILDFLEIKEDKVINEHFSNLRDDIKNGHTLVIMPIDRIVFGGRPILSNYYFMKPNVIKYKEEFTLNSSLFNNNLRDIPIMLTFFSLDVLEKSHCIIFSYNINWNEFKSYKNHHDDITLLNILSSHTDVLFNLIKYNCCDLTLPDTLISPVGSWLGSDDKMGALLFHKDEGSYIISGSAIESSRVVKGIGLELYNLALIEKQLNLLKISSEMSNIIRYSITLYTDALYSHNMTTKFTKMMTLFEYLAYPNNFEVFKKSKKYIICHNVNSKNEYHTLSARFKTLSEEYRTEIVHNGKTLENIIPNLDERKLLLNELQEYYKKVINNMFLYSDRTWEEFCAYRTSLIESYT